MKIAKRRKKNCVRNLQSDLEGAALSAPRFGTRQRVSLQCSVIAIQLLSALTVAAASFDSASRSTNEFGLDLYRKIAAGEGKIFLFSYFFNCGFGVTIGGVGWAERAWE